MSTCINGNNYGTFNGTEPYIGSKVVMAKPMDRLTYNELRGWELPKDEDGSDSGYVLQDLDGYLSWLPTSKFKQVYTRTVGMSFGLAIAAMKAGCKVARSGWNGKGMFLFLVPGSTFKVNRPPLLGIYREGKEINYHAHIDMRTADGTIVPWLASQTDMLSEDWMIVN